MVATTNNNNKRHVARGTKALFVPQFHKTGTLSKCTLLLVLLALFSFFQPTESFAAWLRCWTDLIPDEIIMNRGVVSPLDSTHPDVTVQAYQRGNLVDMDPETSAVLFNGTDDTTYQLRLFVPPELSMSDVQFVTETTEGAEFIRPSPVMCEGKRSHAGRTTGEVTLKLNDDAEKVEVWAAWAAGHEAVKLTPHLIFQRRGSNQKHDGSPDLSSSTEGETEVEAEEL